MKTFRSLFVLVAMLAAGTFISTADLRAETARPGWTDDQAKALEKAKAEHKLVLMDFTGSDWCPYCMKLDKEVLNTPEFKQYVKDRFVLVELDFPERKYISPQTLKQNETLKAEYGVEGFPTVIVVDPTGKPLKMLGYTPDAKQTFLAELKKLKA